MTAIDELIERAERGEIMGDGTVQMRLLVDQKRFAFDRLNALQSAQVEFRDPERTIVCNILANAKPAAMPERNPQRFRYRKMGSNEWEFGAVFPRGRFWMIQAGKGFGSFEFDPWEMMGMVIGTAADFAWIDNDFGWAG